MFNNTVRLMDQVERLKTQVKILESLLDELTEERRIVREELDRLKNVEICEECAQRMAGEGK